tara:strand:- start:215 stop:1150 length:936 start_codon:yes stop_codon:yes gene_type:complete
MVALLFPGQGSQLVGMGSEFYQNFNIVKNFFKEADESLGFSISKIILEGPDNDLKLTQNTQPAILTVSYSIFKVLIDEFGFDINKIRYFAGHSLGEYSALVCSQALTFKDSLYLLHERGKAMQNAVPVGEGSMVAVLGLKNQEIKNLIHELNFNEGVCEIANDNAEGQVIVSGDSSSVNLFQKELKSKRIKCIPLKVSAPFHCSLMKPAAEDMEDKINKINFLSPKIQIVNNVTAKIEKDPMEIKKLLIRQIYSTVNWRESMVNISENGVENFIEIGPGKVLTGMIKRTISGAKTFSINSIADIKNLKDAI